MANDKKDGVNIDKTYGRLCKTPKEKFISDLEEQLEELKEYVVTEPEDIREYVKKIVPTYHPELAGENK